MNKSLIKKILIWTASVAVVVVVSGYLIVDYSINKMLRMVATSDPSSIEVNTSTITSTPVVSTDPTQSTPKPRDSTLTSIATTNDTSPTSPKPSLTTTNPVEAVASPTPVSSPIYDATISTDKAAKVQQQVTLEEKAKISSIFLKRLSASEIKLFSSLASGGLTIEEKVEAKKAILKKLTEAEYNELIQIAAKLGLSQGDSYSKSIANMPQ